MINGELVVEWKKEKSTRLKIIRDNWEKTAVGYGLTRRQIEEMRPAFSACYK